MNISRISLLLFLACGAAFAAEGADRTAVVIVDLNGTPADWILAGGQNDLPGMEALFRNGSSVLAVREEEGSAREIVKMLIEGGGHLFSGRAKESCLLAPAADPYQAFASSGRFFSPSITETAWSAVRERFGTPPPVTSEAIKAAERIRQAAGSPLTRREIDAMRERCFAEKGAAPDPALLKQTAHLSQRTKGVIVTILKQEDDGGAKLTELKPLAAANFRRIETLYKTFRKQDDAQGAFIYLALCCRPVAGKSGGWGCGVFCGPPFRKGIVYTKTVSLLHIRNTIHYALQNKASSDNEPVISEILEKEDR